MNFNDRAVGGKSISADMRHLFLLQSCENSVKHTVLAPAAHAGADAVPIAEITWNSSPFTPMFKDIKYCVQHREVVNSDISSLTRKYVGCFLVVLLCYFHRPTITE